MMFPQGHCMHSSNKLHQSPHRCTTQTCGVYFPNAFFTSTTQEGISVLEAIPHPLCSNGRQTAQMPVYHKVIWIRRVHCGWLLRSNFVLRLKGGNVILRSCWYEEPRHIVRNFWKAQQCSPRVFSSRGSIDTKAACGYPLRVKTTELLPTKNRRLSDQPRWIFSERDERHASTSTSSIKPGAYGPTGNHPFQSR